MNSDKLKKINERLSSYSGYVDELNHFMNPAVDALDSAYSVLIWALPKVNFTGSVVYAEESTVWFKKVEPLVKIALPIEVLEECANSHGYFSMVFTSIINGVQKQWEQQYGSYKNTRYGSHFFKISNIEVPPSDEYGYLSFTGSWASNKDVF